MQIKCPTHCVITCPINSIFTQNYERIAGLIQNHQVDLLFICLDGFLSTYVLFSIQYNFFYYLLLFTFLAFAILSNSSVFCYLNTLNLTKPNVFNLLTYLFTCFFLTLRVNQRAAASKFSISHGLSFSSVTHISSPCFNSGFY